MLNEAKIRDLKPRETMYYVADAEGLYLNVYSTGRKTWIFRQQAVIGRKAFKKLGQETRCISEFCPGVFDPMILRLTISAIGNSLLRRVMPLLRFIGLFFVVQILVIILLNLDFTI